MPLKLIHFEWENTEVLDCTNSKKVRKFFEVSTRRNPLTWIQSTFQATNLKHPQQIRPEKGQSKWRQQHIQILINTEVLIF